MGYGYTPQSQYQTEPLWKKTQYGYAYYHRDHLGTPLLLTDKANAVVWEARYKAFGERNILTAAIANNLGFPGQYYEEETGFWQNWFRDYDHRAGRYVEGDPIGLEGGLNVYGYGDWNPVRYMDIYGLIRWKGTGVIGVYTGKYGVGYGGGDIVVTSECKNGKRLRAKYEVEFWAWGIGTPSVDSFEIEIEDYKNDISVNSLTGDFSYKSIGLNVFGADFGHASIIMGEGISRKFETTGGIGFGMGGTISGTSKISQKLYPYSWEDCGCNEN